MTPTTRPRVVIDVHASLERLAEMLITRRIEPAVAARLRGPGKQVKLWENGLGDVVHAAVAESRLPQTISALDVARALGLLPRVKQVKGARR